MIILGALRRKLAFVDSAIDRNYGLELVEVTVFAAVAAAVVGVNLAAARDIILACI